MLPDCTGSDVLEQRWGVANGFRALMQGLEAIKLAAEC